MNILVELFSMIIIIISLFIGASWIVHISMTKNSCSEYGWGTYKQFKKQFEECELKEDRIFHKSYFSFYGTSKQSQFHASIVQFKSKGMLLSPISWLRACLYVHHLTNANRGKFDWKDA